MHIAHSVSELSPSKRDHITSALWAMFSGHGFFFKCVTSVEMTTLSEQSTGIIKRLVFLCVLLVSSAHNSKLLGIVIHEINVVLFGYRLSRKVQLQRKPILLIRFRQRIKYCVHRLD